MGGGGSGWTLFISFSFFSFIYNSVAALTRMNQVISLLFTIMIDKDRKPLHGYSAHESDRSLTTRLNQ